MVRGKIRNALGRLAPELDAAHEDPTEWAEREKQALAEALLGLLPAAPH